MADGEAGDVLARSAAVSADEWKAYFDWPNPWDPPFLVVCFPNDAVRKVCLGEIGEWSDLEVRRVLRSFLVGSRDVTALDLFHLRFVLELGDGPDRRLSEWDRRAIERYVFKSSAPLWEGLTWVLDLLPSSPEDALQVIGNYTYVHAQELSDIRHVGLADARAIIRTRYLEIDPTTVDGLIELLLSLHWRDFEYFVAALWLAQGYQVEVTSPTKDRGKDAVARRTGANAEAVFLECKNWRGVVPVGVVRELRGAVTKADVNRGVLIATSGFTEGDASATEEASDDDRIALVNGADLVALAHRHFGPDWHTRLDSIVDDSRKRIPVGRQ